MAVMSDLISTPSQAQSTVSNEAFETLIDLLASDGIDQDPSILPGDHVRTQPNATLRDPAGKLDFDKIRLMFAAQNETHRTPAAALGPLAEDKNHEQSPAVPLNEDGDSDDEPYSHQGTSSTLPSRCNSMSPKPAERAAAGHRRSSTFGNQPWAAIHVHENATAVKVEDVPQPLSFDELSRALAGAHEEVRTLRQQYDELQALVSKRLGAEIRDRAKLSSSTVNSEKVVTSKDNGRAETRNAGSQAQPSAIAPPAFLLSDVPTEIDNLSENGAKRALNALARSLNLSPCTIGPLASLSASASPASPQQGLFPPNPTRQHDVASIARAVKFLGTVDELVWRRASGPSGPRTLLPVFSEENVGALVARLELWERAVRRSSRA